MQPQWPGTARAQRSAKHSLPCRNHWHVIVSAAGINPRAPCAQTNSSTAESRVATVVGRDMVPGEHRALPATPQPSTSSSSHGSCVFARGAAGINLHAPFAQANSSTAESHVATVAGRDMVPGEYKALPATPQPCILVAIAMSQSVAFAAPVVSRRGWHSSSPRREHSPSADGRHYSVIYST